MRVLHVGWGFSPWRPGGLIAYAEDLMAAQAERGHAVSYFCSGRHYPRLSGPRLKRRRRGAVTVYEVINPPIVAGLEHGTLYPDRDLDEPRLEGAFRRVVERERPDVVHIQELMALPSSLIEVAADAGVPTLMTLQDYFPLCATLRLYDSDGRLCMRRDVGADCAARNAEGPADATTLARVTVRYELARARRAVGLGNVNLSPLGGLIAQLLERFVRGDEPPLPGPSRASRAAPAQAYQRRRDVNVERLGRVDRLVAQSPRVAEVYQALGVPGERMSTIPFTLSHIERLQPRRMDTPPRRLTFATINGCASPSKGSETVRDALLALRAAGAEGRFRLLVLGYVHDDVAAELAGYEGVACPGAYGPGDLDALLEPVDVGLMPSMWEEAFGYAGLEMIAKGIPLIANPLGGITEYARPDTTAWLNESRSGRELAELMLRLIEEPGRALDMHRSTLAARGELLTPMARHVDAIDELYGDVAGVAA